MNMTRGGAFIWSPLTNKVNTAPFEGTINQNIKAQAEGAALHTQSPPHVYRPISDDWAILFLYKYIFWVFGGNATDSSFKVTLISKYSCSVGRFNLQQCIMDIL